MKQAKLANKRARKAQKRKNKPYQKGKHVQAALKRIHTQMALLDQRANESNTFLV